MRIGMNLLYIAPDLAGGRVYAEGLLKALAQVENKHEYVLFTRQGVTLPALDPERFRQVVAPVAPESALWRTAWEYGLLAGEAKRQGVQLFHGLGTLSPASRHCPFVLTIHDIIYRHFPESLPLGHRWFMRLMHPRVARQADLVIVPSTVSGQDAVSRLGVREDRLRLVPYGAGNNLRPVTDRARIEEVLARLGIGQPYILSVARAYAHKNQAGLLRAFARLRALGHTAVQLVLVGSRYRTRAAIDGLVAELGLESSVVFTEFVNDEDLSALYSGAHVFAFPSLAEGFGLPVLEAMACGAPVVASDASAIPEAVSDAGLLADARNPEAFAAALARVLTDDKLRDELRQRGRRRVAEFSWERNARQTLAVYEELA